MKKMILVDGNNVVNHIANTIEKKEDRYLLVEERLEVFLDYPVQDIDGNITHNYITLYEVDMPEDENITEQRYCYTEAEGFYKNPDWRPYYSDQEKIEMLEDMVNMLILGGEE